MTWDAPFLVRLPGIVHRSSESSAQAIPATSCRLCPVSMRILTIEGNGPGPSVARQIAASSSSERTRSRLIRGRGGFLSFGRGVTALGQAPHDGAHGGAGLGQ
jgi:hypothetical protein